MTYGNLGEYREIPCTGSSTVVHIHRNDTPLLQDSVEIGTPGKGGAIKIYFDSSNVPDAKARVVNALEVRKFAREQIEREG